MRAAANTYKYYLYDLGFDLKEMATAAKEARNAASGEDRAYAARRLMAFYEVISHMQNQAIAFQIDLKDMRLEGVDPDKDLL